MFIMKLLVKMQLPIIFYIDILITIHIWTKGAQEKNVTMSWKWATQLWIYPFGCSAIIWMKSINIHIVHLSEYV
jgi:hypothetical protein